MPAPVDFLRVLIPGVLIFMTVLAFNFFGDGAGNALDPRFLEG